MPRPRILVPKDMSNVLRDAESRRKQYGIFRAQGATRFDVQYIIQDCIRKAAKENRWSSEDVAPLLAELAADLDHVFGPVQ